MQVFLLDKREGFVLECIRLFAYTNCAVQFTQ